MHISSGGKTHIIGCTFLNNSGNTTSYANQIYAGSGTTTIVNSVVWGQSSGTMLAKASGATLVTHYDLVKGQTLTGTGNLAGTSDPKLTVDGHLMWDSPLRGVGGSVAQSRIEMDGEPRPTSAPDIGADQFVDSDNDELADSWELKRTGNLTTLTSRGQDADGDGLTNEQEYAIDTLPTVADTDGDGVSDGDELIHGTNPFKADTDGDDMPDSWEIAHGLSPLTPNAFDDADGDRYPNVFEYAYSSDPSDSGSTPTPAIVVNGAGGGTHTTVSAAVSAAGSQSGTYKIIGIAPGVYTGSNNVNLTATSSTKKLLIIGLEGAGKTILDGGGTSFGWTVSASAVISSLTIRKTTRAFYMSTSDEVRFVDLLVRDNASPSYVSGVHIYSGGKTQIVGCTFLNNSGNTTSYANQIYVGSGTATIQNTVVWGQSPGTMLAKASGATLVTHYDLVKGQTLTGTGNLAGTSDPKLTVDGHLMWDSPLRGAGGSVAQSRIDMDGEIRPASAPDIGADQFVDSDNDELADSWELKRTGDLTTLTSRGQDADGDGLTNEQEYTIDTLPTVADSDGDGVSDGDELLHGTDPLKADTDGDDMPDGWEVAHGLSPLTPDAYEDADGDRFPNVFEYAYSSDPSDSGSTPTPAIVVNGAGGGTHTTVSAAVSAAGSQSGTYKIIGIAPGVYTGSNNVNLTATSSTKKLLIIGLEGAGKTILDGGGTSYGWNVSASAVISSLTIRRMTQYALYVSTSGEVRLVDMLVRDNASPSYASGVHIYSGGKTQIVGCTFLNNSGNTTSYANQIYVGSGTATIQNTVVWGQSPGTMLAKASGATLVTHYDLVKGQTLTGTGNLAGTSDPKLTVDGHLMWDSPLRGAGGSVAQSRIDMDGEIRPASAPDIGADQFVDSDNDELADSWELKRTGNLTTLTSRGQDADGDGLTNEQEYTIDTFPTVADTDGDGASDGDELIHGTDPLKPDTDGDDMPDGWEIAHGLAPLTPDAYEDADGDRFPNVFEYAYSSDPSDSGSTPTPAIVVNGAGGGTHTTVSAAVSAAGSQSGTYKIIGIAPGVYTGSGNVNITATSSTKKLLIIGLEGAGKTIIDGGGTLNGWNVYASAVISSLTMRRTTRAFYMLTSDEVRFVDLLVRDNAGPSNAGGVHNIASGGKTYIVGCTFLNNSGPTSYPHQIYVGSGTTTIQNTLVWGQSTGTMLAKASGATLVTHYDLVKGQTLTGTGNLAGTVDPRLRSDARLASDSPLRGAGGSVAQSRSDMDGELRPISSPDIGVDEFFDGDGDGLPDAWEIARFGNAMTISGAGDEDGDGLNNLGEYDWDTDLFNPDTDGDGVKDGIEVAYGMNPLVPDTDELAADLNGDGLVDSIGMQLGYLVEQLDDDGDSVSNDEESLMCTDRFRPDTDGDGVPDNLDALPRDPLVSALSADAQDVTPPVITLTSPWYAVAQ